MTTNVIAFDPRRVSNLSLLTVQERGELYAATCQSLGLNPLTKPLEFIVLNGKLTLYCLKEGAAQLRKIHGVSLSIAGMTENDGIFTVHVKARTAAGVEDEDIGCVTLPASGEARCNAMMKCITKAKRRVTLSVCGLGLLDETELETIPAGAKRPAEDQPAPVAVELPSHDDTTNVRELDREIETRRAAAQLKSKLPQMVVEPPKRRLDRELAKQRHTGANYEAIIRAEQRKPTKFRQFDERNPPPSDDIPPFLDRRGH